MACVDQGSRLVTHDERFQIENVRRQNTPKLPSILWNIPVRANAFPDALGGWQPSFNVLVRPVSKAEPTNPLRHPSWSVCTLPVVILVDYPYNYKTFVTQALTDIDSMFRIKGLSPNGDATLVLATPAGMALEPYHAVLLSPYSRRPLVTLAELGRRGLEGLPTEWSGEGMRVHCYNKLVACKVEQRDDTAPDVAAAAVVAHLGSALPRDPLGFGDAASDPRVLRVVLEARAAPWRSIRNVQEILKACEEADAKGFSAGPFTRIVCRALPTSYEAPPPATDIVQPDSPGAVAFRNALAAVRSANLFIAAVGSSGAHAFFMTPGGGGGAAAGGLLEVRPCGWGSAYSGAADGGADAMAPQLQKGGDAIRFFAYNVEEAGQCSPPDYEQQLREAMPAMRLEATAHDLQTKPPLRYRPEELLVRDQHLTLRPGPLLAMIKHSAPLLADLTAYQAARESGRLHGYALAPGVLLGPLGLRDAAERAARAGEELLRA